MKHGRVTAAEAYLEGFSDGYHGLPHREEAFAKHGFGERYKEAKLAGEAKREAEQENSVKPADPTVAIYMDGVYQLDASFKYTWQARLFHWLLGKSLRTDGMRQY